MNSVIQQPPTPPQNPLTRGSAHTVGHIRYCMHTWSIALYMQQPLNLMPPPETQWHSTISTPTGRQCREMGQNNNSSHLDGNKEVGGGIKAKKSKEEECKRWIEGQAGAEMQGEEGKISSNSS